MKEKVYFIPMGNVENDSRFCNRIEKAILQRDFLSFINFKDFVAIKTHFGEKGTDGFVRPLYLKMLGGLVRGEKAFPFLTETSTLYRGQRSNAVDHLQLAWDHGFGMENTGMAIIMSDGLLGDEEIEIPINGKILKKVGIGRLISKCQALIVVSHFTGHVLSGFGAALKNMGMGCASRRGKLIQHSTSNPSIKTTKCTGCGECVRWCPQDAISLTADRAKINRDMCIGCGECLAVCRFDAVGYNWSETYENLQKKMVEHALGVKNAINGKIIYLNFLNRITKDCDCMKGFNRIVPDIGVLISFDPVAIDTASVDMIENKMGKKWPQLAFDIPYRIQINYAAEIGLGNPVYDLIDLE